MKRGERKTGPRRARAARSLVTLLLGSAIAAGMVVPAGEPALSGIVYIEARAQNENAVKLSWRYGRPMSQLASFHIFRESFVLRANGTMRDYQPMARVGSTGPSHASSSELLVSFLDQGAVSGAWQCYRVQAVVDDGDALPMSSLVCVFLPEPEPNPPLKESAEPPGDRRAQPRNEPETESSPPRDSRVVSRSKVPNRKALTPEPREPEPAESPEPRQESTETARAESSRPDPSPCGQIRENQIEGKVTRDGRPVSGVEVLMTYRLPGIPAYKYYTHTDQNGRYCFQDLELGEIYKISLADESLNTSPNRHKIKLRKGREAGANFVIVR